MIKYISTDEKREVCLCCQWPHQQSEKRTGIDSKHQKLIFENDLNLMGECTAHACQKNSHKICTHWPCLCVFSRISLRFYWFGYKFKTNRINKCDNAEMTALYQMRSERRHAAHATHSFHFIYRGSGRASKILYIL